ncbi:MAG TPA: chloride channel protein [Clostridia bacterium]|nr:chloride channel protein [Clostridia bacterium]
MKVNKTMRTELSNIKEKGVLLARYLLVSAKWLGLALLCGVVAGAVGIGFHFCVDKVTEWRQEWGYFLWALPALGLVIVFLYKKLGLENDTGTNGVFDSVRHGKKVSSKLAPAIFIGTILTHFGGGSSGREGAALQLGGSVSAMIGRLFKVDESGLRIAELCGMSAVFSALFGTPLTATIFCIEVMSPGLIYNWALLPCLAASLAAYVLSLLCGIAPLTYTLMTVPESTELVTLLKVALLGVMCAVVSIGICESMHNGAKLYKKLFPNPYLRIAVGGTIIIGLTYLVGSGDYNGAGMNVVYRALGGDCVWYAFILKLLFTALTLCAGFKGGEIVPTMFIGATFGCAVGPLLGLDPGFAAAIGLCATFCGATNSPLASIILSVEVFGSQNVLYFALACAISFVLSGNFSLYSSQMPVFSKLLPKRQSNLEL